MILRAYSVYDECTEAFGVPFFVVNDKTAERAFFTLVNDPQSTVFQSPSDFSLYCIGTFDDQKGTLYSSETPFLIGRAHAYVQAHLDGTPREESSHA